MAGQAPTHRVQMTHKQTKAKTKILAGWPSKNGKGVNFRPEKGVRVTVEVTDEHGEVTTHNLGDYWIELLDFGERRQRPADDPKPSDDWGGGKCKHGGDPMSCNECAPF